MALSIGRYTNLDLPPDVRSLLLYFGASGCCCLQDILHPRAEARPFQILPVRGAKKRLKAMGQIYEIVSIEPAVSPFGGKGSNWYRYVIASDGRNTITGYLQGSLKYVTSRVAGMIAELNERHCNKRGRVNLVSTPKKNTHT